MGIQVENLSFSYCTRPVLHEVSFSAKKGELLAVLGPNGVGKSTLFQCILGLHTKYRGCVLLDGQDIRHLPPRQMAHRVAYIPQNHGQTFAYSVEEMVLMGTAHTVGSLSQPREEQRRAARQAMERLSIGHLARRNFCHLSGGEQQLVLIARALAQQVDVLLMDEPTASLDYGNQTMVLSRVLALTEEGYTVLMSTHNPQHALFYADRVLALQDGCVAAFGKPEEVMTPTLLERLYGTKTRFVSLPEGQMIVPIQEDPHVSVDR